MKDNHMYTSDVMHCRQDDCKKKNKCYRYWLGQQRREGIVTMFNPKETPEDCKYFSDVNKY